MLKTFIIFFCLLFLLQGVRAQDANYWSSNYNPAGFLTPGAVIAFNRDSGVMFLNPALLAYSNKTTASISGSIYQYSNIRTKNGAGTGLNLNSSSAAIIPQIVSATISFKGKKPFTLGYALIHNPVMNYQVTQQRDAKFNVLNDSYSPGDESFLGQVKKQSSINETTGIISGGFKIADHWALGLWAEGQLRKQTGDYDASSRALINVNTNTGFLPLSLSEQSYLASYYQVGLRFKTGLAYDEDRHHFGLTITSPLMHIASRANILSDNAVNNLIIPSDDPASPGSKDTINFLINSRQQKLKAIYKMPLSIGFGYAYDYEKGQIYFAAEYFAKVNEYSIISPRDVDAVKGEVPIRISAQSDLRLKDVRRSVINFGFGASYLLRPDVTGFVSLHTDFNYANNDLYKDDNGSSGNIAYYNIYHCQLGANLKRRKFNFRAGLLLSYGTTNKYLQDINFDNPNENNLLAGDPVTTHTSHFSAGLLLTYIHNL
ncbi:hypothetical protein [Mucilaginibacter sp. 22184]|uniref:hypothetical protein n=1 Tax=Mucilaginibacter sp. 22184 TaxID=3453887 RepID=UPI003F87373F